MITHLFALMSPGPDFTIIINHSTKYGHKHSTICAIGIASGIAVHVSIILLGLGEFINSSSIVYNTIALLGAGYLTYIAWNLISSKRYNENDNSNDKDKNNNEYNECSSVYSYTIGLLTNLLNVKAILFFLSILVPLADKITLTLQLFLAIFFILSTFSWFTFVGIIFSRAIIRIRFLRYSYIVDKLLALILLFFVTYILFDIFI